MVGFTARNLVASHATVTNDASVEFERKQDLQEKVRSFYFWNYLQCSFSRFKNGVHNLIRLIMQMLVPRLKIYLSLEQKIILLSWMMSQFMMQMNPQGN